jgi:hypothetical protein
MHQRVIAGEAAQAAVEVEVGLDPAFQVHVRPCFAHGVEEAAQLRGSFGSVSPLRQRSCGHGL